MRAMKNLFDLATEYVAVIEKIEHTSDPRRLQLLEEKRVALHGEFLEMLQRQGIQFRDRDHATLIAFRIAKGEL
jgi:hypothetical protein